MGARHVPHDRQQHAGRDHLVAQVGLEIGGREGRERRLRAGRVQRVGVVLEQRLHGERVQPLVRLGVAATRRGQEGGAGVRDILLGERGMHDAVGHDVPGDVEIAHEPRETEHRPIELRLGGHGAAGAGQRPVRLLPRKLARAIGRRAQQQGLDARGPFRELPGAAEQVEAHRDDVVRPGHTLDDADTGRVVHGGEGIRRAGRGKRGRAVWRGEQQARRHDRERAHHANAAHRGAAPPICRNHAASCSVVSGGASTPITRGRPTM